MDRLAHLYHEFGQSPWLDNLKRGYITSGQLRRLVDKGIRGLTSNPTIFQKAIQGSADYDEQFAKLASANNPIIDDHILGAITLIVLAAFGAGDTWGLGRWWKQESLGRDIPVLR